jgi:hypothetical protein
MHSVGTHRALERFLAAPCTFAVPQHESVTACHEYEAAVGWHHTCPLRGRSARGQYRKRSAERTRAAAGGRIGKPKYQTVCSVALAGWMVWWYTVIYRLIDSQTVHKDLSVATLLFNNLTARRAGCRRGDGGPVFTAPPPVTYGRRSCSSSFRKVAPLEDAAQQASTLTNLVHA